MVGACRRLGDRFRRVGAGTEWRAVREGPECCILIEAQNVDLSELTLVPVEDVEPYIAGKSEWTRDQRGET